MHCTRKRLVRLLATIAILYFFVALPAIYLNFVRNNGKPPTKFELEQKKIDKDVNLILEQVKSAERPISTVSHLLNHKNVDNNNYNNANNNNIVDHKDNEMRNNKVEELAKPPSKPLIKEENKKHAVLDEGLNKFPDSYKLLMEKGNQYFDKQNWNEAAQFYEKAYELNTDDTGVISKLATVYNKMKKYSQSSKYYKILHEKRKTTGSLVSYVDSLWRGSDWTNYTMYRDQIVEATRESLLKDKAPVTVYMALHLPFTLHEMLQIGAAHAKNTLNGAKRSGASFTHKLKVNQEGRIRVGYVSFDFRNHAVGLAVKSMFGLHNRSRFEIFCIDAFKENTKDHIYNKIKSECEHMVSVFAKMTKDAATIVNNLNLDILVDFGLYTAGTRMDIFAARAAPIQVAYLGLAATTGATFYDYILADHTVVPDENKEFYSEKVVRLPHSYHVLDHRQAHTAPVAVPRSKYSWPENRFLYCNPANNQRNDPITFEHWTNIIKKVENSSLVLKDFGSDVTANLKAEAKKRGLTVQEGDGKIDPNNPPQLFFLQSSGDHIAQKSLCNCYLDIPKYNGHSTSADMLWAGVPMVTFPQQTMASRAAASFAMSMGLPEMVVNSWEEYEDLAVSYAKEQQKYESIHFRLETRRPTSPLFDTPRWVKNLETAYEEMLRIYNAGMQPQHIDVVDRFEPSPPP